MFHFPAPSLPPQALPTMYTGTAANGTILDSEDPTNLSQQTTQEIEITIYVLLFSAGILTWDIVSNLGDDFHMLTKYPLRTPIIAYFISRLSALGLLITGLFIGPAKMEIDCHAGAVFLELFFFLVVSSTTALFALRARAVYSGYPFVRAVFLILWLVNTGSCLLAFFVLDSKPNPDRRISSCLFVEKDFITGITIAIAAMIHDTTVFLAISYHMYRIARFSDPDRKVVELFAFMNPKLPALWRCILQDGQLFYLIALFWQVLITALVVTPSLGIYYRCFLLSAQLVIVNSIACHVFRNVRLGKFRENAFSFKNTFGNIDLSNSVEPQSVSTVQFAHADRLPENRPVRLSSEAYSMGERSV
ncbi:hypothetical protein VKT23_015393 [Stygiomarasmius scandens]|uniref:Uncharacterized protein n=1 Tax=Marasmiellus scandens TaxID=2682957 RepID=A0ABR1J222_9AGAR